MKEYIKIDETTKYICEPLKRARDGYGDQKEKERIGEYFDDDCVECYAKELAEALNSDMKLYLHKNDKGICGNFNNAERDYQSECKDKFSNMLERLDNGEQSKEAERDRRWLTNWMWQTFGIYDMVYKFECAMSEWLYNFELEMA